MPTEAIQMLVSTLNRYHIPHRVPTKAGSVHKGGYSNHPCTLWVGSSTRNFYWTIDWCREMCTEYTRRYGRKHFASTQLEEIVNTLVDFPITFTQWELTEPPKAMPDKYKHYNTCCQSYQAYLIGEKTYMAAWTFPGKRPVWWF